MKWKDWEKERDNSSDGRDSFTSKKQKLSLKNGLSEELTNNLIQAISEGDFSTFTEIVDSTPDIYDYSFPLMNLDNSGVTSEDNFGYNIMHLLAFHGGEDEMFRYVLDKFPSKLGLDTKSSNGLTPFLLAVKEGRISVAWGLIDFGADVEAIDNDGNNALHYAVLHGESIIEFFDYLLTVLDVREVNKDGVTPLLLAEEKGYIRIFDKLALHTLFLDIKEGNLEEVEKLLGKGVSINQVDSEGNTALLVASQEGHVEVVELLIDRGANIDYVNNKDGSTALLVASREGHAEVVKLLIDKRANIDYVNDEDGSTALLVASREGHAEVVKLLIGRGVDVNYVDDEDGNTALLVASQEGHAEVVELLIDRGAKIDYVNDEDGNTALLVASREGHAEVVKLLIDKRANIDYVNDEDGNTALLVASQGGHIEVVRELLKTHNINFSFKNILGKDCLKLAKEKGDEEIIHILEIYSCFRSIIDKSANISLLTSLIRSEQDIKFIGALINRFFYFKGVFSQKELNRCIESLELKDFSVLKDDQHISFAKSYNLHLREIKCELSKTVEEFKKDLFTLEQHLVSIYDPVYQDILLQNSMEQSSSLGHKWPVREQDNKYSQASSFLGLIGRKTAETNPNGYEGEIYGEGLILKKFLNKVKSQGEQDQELLEPMLLNTEGFKQLCALFTKVKIGLPSSITNKIDIFSKQVGNQISSPIFKLLSKVIHKNDHLSEILSEVTDDNEHVKAKLREFEEENEKLENRSKNLAFLIKDLIKGLKGEVVDYNSLDNKLLNITKDLDNENPIVERPLEMALDNDNLNININFREISGDNDTRSDMIQD